MTRLAVPAPAVLLAARGPTEPAAAWWPGGFVAAIVVLAVAGLAAAAVGRQRTRPRRVGWFVLAGALLVAPGLAFLIARGGDRTVEVDGRPVRCAAFGATPAATVEARAVRDDCRSANVTRRAGAAITTAAGLLVAATGALVATGQLGPGARPPRPGAEADGVVDERGGPSAGG